MVSCRAGEPANFLEAPAPDYFFPKRKVTQKLLKMFQVTVFSSFYEI